MANQESSANQTEAARERMTRGIREAIRVIRHDFRTSLNQIIGYSEMMGEELAELGRRDLEADLVKIQAAAAKMLGLVNSTFDVESGGGGPAAAPGPSAGGPEAEGGVRGPTAAPEASGSLLVVDDNEMNRDMLTRRLVKQGYRVATASDGHEALRRIDEERFDVVLLDVMMPGMSGLDVLQVIRKTRLPAELPVIMATSRDASEDIVRAFALGANDYVTKPLDFPVVLARLATQLSLKRMLDTVEMLAAQLEMRNAFLRKIFGRYLADEIVDDLLADPGKLALGGEKRHVTVLMSDLRGFSSLVERLAPEDVITLLNLFLSRMTEVIGAYAGTIDEFIGDAILAVFGAPVGRPDDVERAVACAVAMQKAMADVNRALRERGLPEVSMGIGLNTGPAIVGNVGSEKRAKYAVVGPTVVLASRIESCTTGGQILVSAPTYEEVKDLVEVRGTLQVCPKGSPRKMTLYDIAGVGGRHGLRLDAEPSEVRTLARPAGFLYALVEDKACREDAGTGVLLSLSQGGATARLGKAWPAMTEIRLSLSGDGAAPVSGFIYAKVLFEEGDADEVRIRFTSMDPEARARLEALE